MNSKGKIIKNLKEHLINNFGKEIEDVILFGSQDSGSASVTSDYDVLIIINKQNYSGDDKNKILDLCYDIDLKYDILLDVHLLSKQEIKAKRGNQPIYIDAVKTGLYA